MDDRSSQDQPHETEPADEAVDPREDREPQEEHRERADTVDGVLSPGTTADGSPTSRGE